MTLSESCWQCACYNCKTIKNKNKYGSRQMCLACYHCNFVHTPNRRTCPHYTGENPTKYLPGGN